MKLGRLRRMRRWLARRMRDAHVSVFAASGAFYFFLSLAPLLIVLLSVLPLTPLTADRLAGALFGLTPEPFRALAERIIGEIYGGAGALLGLSAGVQLWSGAKFLSCLVRGVGEIYGRPVRDGALRLRLRGVVYTALLLVFAALGASLVVFGEELFALLGRTAPALADAWNALMRFRGALFLTGMTGCNALLFCAVGRRGRDFFRQLPGAAGAALAWYAFSRLYSWLLTHLNAFGAYGSLSAVAMSLFWLYYSVYILLLGALGNTLPEFFQNSGGEIDKPPSAV